MKRIFGAAAMAAWILSGCETGSSARVGSPTPAVAPTPQSLRATAQEEKPDASAEQRPSAPPRPVAAGEVGLSHECTGSPNHLARARERVAAKDMEGALLEARRAAFDAPASADALELTADLAEKSRDRALARSAGRALARAQPNEAAPMVRLALLLLRDRDGVGALAAAEEAQRRDPKAAEAYNLSGRANLMLGRSDDAIFDFLSASRLNPNHGFAFNNLGLAYLLAGKPQKSVSALEKAAALLPNVAFVHNNLGIAHERLGEKTEARAEYSRALELEPSYVKAAVNKARLSALATAESLAVDAAPAQPPSDVPAPAASEGVRAAPIPSEESTVEPAADEP